MFTGQKVVLVFYQFFDSKIDEPSVFSIKANCLKPRDPNAVQYMAWIKTVVQQVFSRVCRTYFHMNM